MNESTILNTVPAANALNKVPGFDPMEHLRRAVSKQSESVMQLVLRYQRLWFRLAYPKGRMLLNPLRITNQLAIFEAKVFFQEDDSAPISSFTSNKSARETRDYIRAAQDEALQMALDNAGFGIQLCDVTQPPVDTGHRLSAPPIQTAPSSQEQSAPVNAPVDPPPTQRTAAPTAEEAQAVRQTESNIGPEMSAQGTDAATAEKLGTKPAPVQSAAFAQAAASPVVAETAPESDPAPQPAAQSDNPEVKSTAVPEGVPAQAIHQDTALHAALAGGESLPSAEVLDFPASPTQAEAAASQSAESVPNPVPIPSDQAETPTQAAPSYSENMTVEEICKVMTLDEARNVVVTKGTCNGWTMGQVAEKRFASLRFYLSGFGHCNNIQLAAATLLMQDVEQKKAS